MTNISAFEINMLRPFFVAAINQLHEITKLKEGPESVEEVSAISRVRIYRWDVRAEDLMAPPSVCSLARRSVRARSWGCRQCAGKLEKVEMCVCTWGFCRRQQEGVCTIAISFCFFTFAHGSFDAQSSCRVVWPDIV
jgi:hypothetical protein